MVGARRQLGVNEGTDFAVVRGSGSLIVANQQGAGPSPESLLAPLRLPAYHALSSASTSSHRYHLLSGAAAQNGTAQSERFDAVRGLCVFHGSG